MRIVIEIDGEKVTAQAYESSRADASPPPAVLRAAAALGATNAGAAPGGPGKAVPVSELPAEALRALGIEPTDAGGAAEAPPRPKARRKPTKARSSKAARGRRTRR